MTDLWYLVRKRADGYRHDEEIPFEADWPVDRERLWLLLGEAEDIQRAARDLVEELKSEFARTLDENESVRLGDYVYKVSVDRREKITDPRALVEFLGEDLPHVVPVTSSTRLRKGGIDAVCEKRGIDRRTFEETFMEVEWGDRKLRAVPVSKAPKYAQSLEHGESTFGRGK